MTKKKGFTLLELSIVIIIISVLATLILSGSSLVSRAKTVSIYNEVAAFRINLLNFRTQELCLPGECSSAYLQFQGFASSYYAEATVSGGCGAGIGIYAFTGKIDTPIKRSCAFSQLQKKNYVQGLTVLPSNMAASLTNQNIPQTTFNKNASWDLRSSDTTGLYPIELSANLGSSPPSATSANFVNNWIGSHALILRNTVSVSSSTLSNDDIVSPPSGTTNGILPPYIANMLDLKFDDGSPLTGTIIAGVNNGISPNITTGSIATTQCYNMAIGGTFMTITGKEIYGNSKSGDFENSCVVAFQISNF